MSRIPLHLLLVLSLAFNAIAAPWAMARMQHGGHVHGVSSVEAPAQDLERDAGHDHAAMLHASPHDHAAMSEAAMHDHAPMPEQTTAHDDSACCDGAMCGCGCILPPAVPFLATVAFEPQSSLPVDVPHPALAIVARGSPPFRPPAV